MGWPGSTTSGPSRYPGSPGSSSSSSRERILMRARQVVQERLTQAYALPHVSKPPQMIEPLSSTEPGHDGPACPRQELSPIDMSVIAHWTIKPPSLGVPGVANVAIWGQRERQLQVQVDPERLREIGVSLLDVIETTGNALVGLAAELPGSVDPRHRRVYRYPEPAAHGIQHLLADQDRGRSGSGAAGDC